MEDTSAHDINPTLFSKGGIWHCIHKAINHDKILPQLQDLKQSVSLLPLSHTQTNLKVLRSSGILNHVYKLGKPFYWLEQVLKAWLETLSQKIGLKEEKYFRYLSVAKKSSLADKVAMFSAETEDIAAARCCANILWT
ncbi:hypothetical protein Tco_0210181 [Tanacetum coccineum]